MGYLDRKQGVFVNRKIIHIKPDLYVIMDEMYTGDAHCYQQYWNFCERGSVTLGNCIPVKTVKLPGLEEAGNPDPTLHKSGALDIFSTEQIKTPAVQTAVFSSDRAQAEFFFMTPGACGELYQGKIARHYNRYEERQGIRVSVEGNGFTSLLTVIRGGEKENLSPCRVTKLPVKSALKGIFYPAAMAEGVKIEADGKEYVLIICHQEVNSPTDMVEADGCLGYGSVIVFDKAVDDKVGTVLCY